MSAIKEEILEWIKKRERTFRTYALVCELQSGQSKHEEAKEVREDIKMLQAIRTLIEEYFILKPKVDEWRARLENARYKYISGVITLLRYEGLVETVIIEIRDFREGGKMKIAKYKKVDGSYLEVEYDETAPCVVCGLPVENASMGGTNLCPSCDCGKHRNGIGFSYEEEEDNALLRANAKKYQDEGKGKK